MSDSQSTWHLPTTIHFGPGTTMGLQLPEGTRTALVVSGSLARTAPVADLCRRLREAGMKLQVLPRGSGEPESDHLDALFRQMDPGTEAVLGIGGGSTLDSAKFLAMLAVSGGRAADYDLGRRPVSGALPLYLVPTTMGSGSETTPYAVAANSATRRKFTIGHPALFPAASWVDPTWCLGVNEATLIAGALDTLVHCLEAALNACRHPLAEPLAETGLELVLATLPRALRGGLDAPLAAELAQASLCGGMAIAHSRTGLVHTLAVALAEYLPTAHGALNGALLPAVLAFNAGHYEGRLARLVGRVMHSTPADDAAAIRVLLDWLQPLLPDPPPWREHAWSPADCDHLLERVLQDKGLPGVNPRPLERAQLARLIQGIVTDAHR